MEPKATILQKPREVVASAVSVHFLTAQGLTKAPTFAAARERPYHRHRPSRQQPL